MALMLYLPDQVWTVASRSDLSSAAKASTSTDRQFSVTAEGARIPVVYGRDRRGALIANIVAAGAYLYVQAVWSLGPIHGIESITMSDAPLPTGSSVRHYTGTPGQVVDSWLVSAFAGRGISYTDALPGVAYSVLRIPIDAGIDPSSIAAIVKGRLLYDPRTGLTAWSDNPALALADFLSASAYGLGRLVAWSSVITAADACDVLVGGQRRRRLGLTLADARPCETWVEALRTYASCFVVQRGDGYHLIPDAPAAAVRSFSHDAGNIARLGALVPRRRADAPTVVIVRWTDTTALPWRDRTASAYAPGVLTGTVERRESEVPLPGVQSASQAYREAVERLNKLSLTTLSCDLDVFDDGGDIEAGDIVTVSHPRGLHEQPFRATAVAATGPGRYTLTLEKHDPAAYSLAVVTEPSTPDTSLPPVTAPPALDGLTVVEEVFQLLDSTWSSRLRITWAAPVYPWVGSYRVDLRVGGVVVQTGTAPRGATVWPSPPVQERVAHQIDVVLISSTGAESPAATVTITPQGKYLAPGNVGALTGYEVGGEVRLFWTPAIDIDIWRYEIRWGAVGVSWAAATLIDRTDTLRLVTGDIPAGTWDFLVCAIDSIRQYSPTPARRTITVSLDNAAFLVDQCTFSSPSVTGMQAYTLADTDPDLHWITDDAVTFAARFTAALATYTNPLASYSAGPAEWLTEAFDFGRQLVGNWTGELTLDTLTGATTTTLELSADGTTWDVYSGLVAKAGGRYVRLRASATGVLLASLPHAGVRVDAIPKTEEGTATSSTTTYTRITLDAVYAAVKGLPQITVSGTTPALAVVDNIVTGSPTTFDVYVFDLAGDQIARPFGYLWKGY